MDAVPLRGNRQKMIHKESDPGKSNPKKNKHCPIRLFSIMLSGKACLPYSNKRQIDFSLDKTTNTKAVS
jgi:hypothetical protein